MQAVCDAGRRWRVDSQIGLEERLDCLGWATVAPLLQRWQMALVPAPDGSWDVLAGSSRMGGVLPPHDARHVSCAALPQAIWDLSRRCEESENVEK